MAIRSAKARVFLAANALFKKDYRHDNPIIAYRIHQWQASDRGVVGMSARRPSHGVEQREIGQHAGQQHGGRHRETVSESGDCRRRGEGANRCVNRRPTTTVFSNARR